MAILLAIAILRTLTTSVPTTAPGSHLVFDRPPNWRSADAGVAFDDAWAVEQKRKYPLDAPLIDSLVEGVRSGGLSWFAVIDTNGDQAGDGWILIAVQERSAVAKDLRDEATTSVIFQSVELREGTTAVDVALPIGPAVRLDWSYDLRNADGTSEIGTVRSYWLADGPNTVAVQLTYYGEHPELVTSLDEVATTFRWTP